MWRGFGRVAYTCLFEICHQHAWELELEIFLENLPLDFAGRNLDLHHGCGWSHCRGQRWEDAIPVETGSAGDVIIYLRGGRCRSLTWKGVIGAAARVKTMTTLIGTLDQYAEVQASTDIAHADHNNAHTLLCNPTLALMINISSHVRLPSIPD